jgi:hypothetical protein
MKFVLIGLLSVALLCGCNAREQQASRAEAMVAAAPAPMMTRGKMAAEMAADVMANAAPDKGAEKSAQAPAQHFIALSHQLTVETDSAALQKVFEDAIRRCEAAGCEVLSSSLTRGDDYTAPSAYLSARIPPQAVDRFLSGLEGGARVIQHQRQAEDKTAEVVDAEAHIANLTELRDRLRTMLANRPGSIKDVLEVERELAETQSKLDSMRGVRKALANETEKVAMNIQFQSRPSISEQSFFAPVVSAWHDAGRALMRSIGDLIEFLALALPWVLAGIPLTWALRAMWRKKRRMTKD